MNDNILIAVIAAIPPTIAAIAAIWQTRKLSRPIEDVNRAVNHRQPGQRTLIETVECIADELGAIRQDITNVDERLQRHLAYHQLEKEREELE